MDLKGNNYFGAPVIVAPGFRPEQSTNRRIIQYGRQLRDEDAFKYPMMQPAIQVYQQMAASREWRVIGTKTNARGIGRAIDYLNNAVTVNYFQGFNEVGFEQFLKRLVMDYLCIGRTIIQWKENSPLQYIDPAHCFYVPQEKEWSYFSGAVKYPQSEIIVHHPFPLGGYGHFTSPLMSIIPTAMLAYLIRAHDIAEADGSKVRDIYVLASKEMVRDFEQAITDSINSYNGYDPTSNSVAVVSVETLGQVAVRDTVHRIGLANIPDNFDRKQFNYHYTNELANALGLALRQIWSGEEGTNRALEEVQEHRQTIKGPNVFLRSVERQINNSGMLRQFGPNVRFEVIEEVDVSTRQLRADILLKFAQSMKILKEIAGDELSFDELQAYGVAEGVLLSNIQTIETQEVFESDKPNNTTKTLGYDDVAYDMNGNKIETRSKVFHITNAIQDEMQYDPPATFENLVLESRLYNRDVFMEKSLADAEVFELRNKCYNRYDELTDDEHMLIYNYITGNV